MKSKSEINYLPEDKQNSTVKKEKREFKIPFLHSLYIFVCSMKVVGDNVVKYTECSIFWCTWTWIIHEVVPPPTSYNNKTTLTFSRSLLEYYKKAEHYYVCLCAIDQNKEG